MDAAACIGCGACVAACPNGAGQLFTAAKVAHLNLLPQGQAERYKRVEAMVDTMEEFFGSCTNHGECQEACPKEISIDFIALMNKDYLKAKFKNRAHAQPRLTSTSPRGPVHARSGGSCHASPRLRRAQGDAWRRGPW